MLRQVRIENLVLARELLLEFDPGLNLITGETGAGKSLIVGAVALALGGRGEAAMVRQGEDRAVIEALFDVAERPDLQQRLTRAGYEIKGNEILVRREVGADGRSRGFLNGASVTIALLKDLLAGLVEMHGQHEPQTLFQPELHRAILDRFGRHEELLAEVRRESKAIREIDQRLTELADRAAQRRARIELVTFRLAEFDAVRPLPGEEQKLRAERERLRHAEALGEALRAAFELLYEGEGAALDRIHAAARRLRPQGSVDPLYTDLADRLDDVRSQIDDVAADIRSQLDEAAADPARLEQLEERLVALERLRRRFDGASLEDIVGEAESMRRELGELIGQGDSAELLARERESRVAAYAAAAGRLTAARSEAAERLAASTGRLMRELMMPNAKLEVEFQPGTVEELAGSPAGAEGVEQVEFLLAANPGEPARPLRKVASGGELSRVMLALDLSLERGLPRRTLLFDEVDQGIGGEAADVLAEFLAKVGRRHQVICITHLPSIAARAERHVSVTKKLKAGRTHVVVKVLDDEDDRVEEVARMLGGTMVTDTARRHAEAMIRAAREGA
ncbi:MAG: DNA repair protein RecN [Acidobacteria bacterium]|jgi:DNA repair protein RecN (Recombination protein N)|nr:DNA repair protein RecN [Acidobacteriota bacterium]